MRIPKVEITKFGPASRESAALPDNAALPDKMLIRLKVFMMKSPGAIESRQQ
jgi:hypothetical protein